MKIRNVLLCAAMLGAPLVGMAQWQWVDHDGRKVFSDRPPPSDIPEKSILRQPGERQGRSAGARGTRALSAPAAETEQAAATTAQAPAEAQPPQVPASAPAAPAAPAGVDAKLEAERKKQEAAAKEQEAQQQRQAEAANLARKKDNCERARRVVQSLESGRMMAHTNEKGETGFMDEATRTNELRRAQEVVRRDCA